MLHAAREKLVPIRGRLNSIGLALCRLLCGKDPRIRGRAWHRIFEKADWLKKAAKLGACPTLIGTDLPGLAGGQANLYLLLADFDLHGDLRYDIDTFLDCLRRPYTLDKKRWEVCLEEGITVAIHALKWSAEVTPVDTERIFTDARPEAVSTYYMFWDHPELFKTRRGNLGSQGGPSATDPITQALTLRPSHPDFDCVFKLVHPKNGPMGWFAVRRRGPGHAPAVQDGPR
ncbi:uncharacterized protein A1O9_13053 [Exophiala aquamarina CBS 119918]|uniref:Uncharacterized protein n=1 Tax=Exophiala aquamarina CBS 119918 TaxID=1182545 RepID=A0A072NV30_9EURO|nr:uncharacterized protein A1O9_13053 [Exophiala aquamarina CBS 119918]KEF50893.1 hypothetical protein A1O9_13053 [Exophiala aquamarina CBS 119918]